MSGEALIHLRAGGETCLILLDLMMPVMNGWEFREAQLADSTLASMPIIVVTADSDAREKAEQLSADGFLRKPVRPLDVIQAVNRYCGEAFSPAHPSV